jgi:hypothetical protein
MSTSLILALQFLTMLMYCGGTERDNFQFFGFSVAQ